MKKYGRATIDKMQYKIEIAVKCCRLLAALDVQCRLQLVNEGGSFSVQSGASVLLWRKFTPARRTFSEEPSLTEFQKKHQGDCGRETEGG